MNKVVPPPRIPNGTELNFTHHVEEQGITLSVNHGSLVLSFGFDEEFDFRNMKQVQVALSIPAANQLSRSIRNEVKKYLKYQPESE